MYNLQLSKYIPGNARKYELYECCYGNHHGAGGYDMDFDRKEEVFGPGTEWESLGEVEEWD